MIFKFGAGKFSTDTLTVKLPFKRTLVHLLLQCLCMGKGHQAKWILTYITLVFRRPKTKSCSFLIMSAYSMLCVCILGENGNETEYENVQVCLLMNDAQALFFAPSDCSGVGGHQNYHSCQ